MHTIIEQPQSMVEDLQYFEHLDNDDQHLNEHLDNDDQYLNEHLGNDDQHLIEHLDNDDQHLIEHLDNDDQHNGHHLEQSDDDLNLEHFDDRYFECPDDGLDFEQQSDEESIDRAQTDEADDLQTDDTPLYAGASITVNVTMVLLLAFAVRHKLTNKAISDLLYRISRKFGRELNLAVGECLLVPSNLNPPNSRPVTCQVTSGVKFALQRAYLSVAQWTHGSLQVL